MGMRRDWGELGRAGKSMIKTFYLKFSVVVFIIWWKNLFLIKIKYKEGKGEINGIMHDCFLFEILFLWILKKVLFLQKNIHWIDKINISFKWSLSTLFITSESKENCQRTASENWAFRVQCCFKLEECFAGSEMP